jgi:hypothetical protein
MRLRDEEESATVWMWFWFLTFSFWPRLFILGFWIFGSQLGDAYSSWVIPAVGFFLVPSTTAAYALMWGLSSDVVSGWEWLAVAVGVLFDVWMWGSWQRLRED